MTFDTLFDTFFKELPKAADIKAEIELCHKAIKDHNSGIVDERTKIKRLRRLLALAEAEAGKVVKRGPRKKKAPPADDTVPMFGEQVGEAVA